MAKMKTAASVDEYIVAADPQAQKALRAIRKTIKAAAPKAEEVISYQIPGYKYHGMLVFFAAWKNHISLYPAPWGAASPKREQQLPRVFYQTLQEIATRMRCRVVP